MKKFETTKSLAEKCPYFLPLRLLTGTRQKRPKYGR